MADLPKEDSLASQPQLADFNYKIRQSQPVVADLVSARYFIGAAESVDFKFWRIL